MSLYLASIPQLRNVLVGMEGWLDKLAVHAQSKGFDPEDLLSARLAPDQYPLLRQRSRAKGDQRVVGRWRRSGRTGEIEPHRLAHRPHPALELGRHDPLQLGLRAGGRRHRLGQREAARGQQPDRQGQPLRPR